MSKTLLRPPDGTQSFTFRFGCGEPHEYDGVHGIDCTPCVDHVRTMSLEERVAHPHLRAPIVASGETQGAVDTMRRVEEAKRHAASWRLVDTDDAEQPDASAGAPDDALTAEVERLRAENDALKARLSRKPRNADQA